MAIEDSVRNLVREEMKRFSPEFINDLFQRFERKMEEKLEHVIPQILNRFENIMHQRANGMIDHTSQLPRSVPIEDVQPASDLQLAFTDNLLLPRFSEDEIKDEDHDGFQVSLMQIKHGQRCVCEHHSPLALEMVVFHGDFAGENSQDWNTDEFNRSILKKRENKRSLLIRESKAQLNKGIASFRNLKLTDNSSWARTRKFRLGVRVSPGSYKGPRIKEAITESFQVLDHRSKFNQKPQTPSLDHQVWKLRNIGRNGAIHRRLEAAGIKNVHDFLKHSVVDRQRLREIIKMSDKKWGETIRHAMKCKLGDDLYLYHVHRFTVKLNPICEVVEVKFDGVTTALTQFTSEQKVWFASAAYRNWNQLERVVAMPNTIGAQKQNSIKKCGLESDEPRCSNPLDGSQRELSAGNVTPRLGASVCVREQLPSPQRAGAENQNCNSLYSNGGTMEAQQQSDHLGDQDGPAALWNLSFDCPCWFCGNGESLGWCSNAMQAGAENQNRNPSDSNGGTMEAQQQSDHFGDQGRSAALWSPSLQLAWSPYLFCDTGESPGETNIGDIWQ